jgi:hypothetical protein
MTLGEPCAEGLNNGEADNKQADANENLRATMRRRTSGASRSKGSQKDLRAGG